MNMSDRFDLVDGKLYWKWRTDEDICAGLHNSGHFGNEAGGSNPEIVTINKFKFSKESIIRAIKYEQSASTS